jgi:pimeloyl-ACP methyl ester carboxylesterase/DNA-binding CsgD family transcriptional regulator
MTDNTINKTGISPGAVLAVVEALYAYADEPAQWKDITAAVEALPQPLDPSRDPEAATIVGHAARAAAMIERLNAGRPIEHANEAAWDAVLLTSERRVRVAIGCVEDRLAPFLAKPIVAGEPVSFNLSASQIFGEALQSATASQDTALAPFTLESLDESSKCFGVVLARDAFPRALSVAFGLNDVWAEPLYALVLLSAREVNAIGKLAPRRYGLTAAESRLAAQLLRGLTVTDAAAELGVTTNTARSYLKNIFVKTGARRQVDLLRLLTTATEFPAQLPNGHPMAFPGSPPRRFVTLEDGRKLYYREYGVPTGRPVVYFHFGLAASLMTPEAANAALKARVRVIAFDRPGFGQSDIRQSYTFENIAADVDELCRCLNLKNITLFGDGYGGGFAVAAALRMGPTVRRLALRGPNLGRTEATADRRSLLTALFRQPWIIPGAAEMLRRGLRVSVIRSMLSYYAERSRSDAARIADPYFAAYLNSTIFDALERSSTGLSSELIMFASGARVDPAPLTCPIAVWHGEDNPAVPVKESVLAFSNHPTTQLHILRNAGLYLTQPVFEEIFGWLAETSAPDTSRRAGEQPEQWKTAP